MDYFQNLPGIIDYSDPTPVLPPPPKKKPQWSVIYESLPTPSPLPQSRQSSKADRLIRQLGKVIVISPAIYSEAMKASGRFIIFCCFSFCLCAFNFTKMKAIIGKNNIAQELNVLLLFPDVL